MTTEIIEKRIRSRDLIATFENGYASNFKMAVGEYFKDALDIKLFERKENGIPSLVWTQGRLFNFQKGDTFYDYKCKPNESWSESLKYMTYALQIVSAIPCSIQVLGDSSGIKEELEEENTKKDKRQYKYDHGNVQYKVLIVNESRTELKIQCTKPKECTQVEFINILKNGLKINNIESNQMELFLS